MADRAVGGEQAWIHSMASQGFGSVWAGVSSPGNIVTHLAVEEEDLVVVAKDESVDDDASLCRKAREANRAGFCIDGSG